MTGPREGDIGAVDPPAVAETAGLTYVSDEDAPGYERRRRGRGWSYVAPDGRVAAGRERERIDALAVPPAWTDVWVALDPDAHLRATGRDDAGRKQYRYHDRWRDVRDSLKFERLAGFAESLPDVRAEVAGRLQGRRLSRNRVLASVVRLLDTTLIRVGNEAYVADNDTYGATTLRPEHVQVSGRDLTLLFTGKGGLEHTIPVEDHEVRRVIRQCLERTPDDLFGYEDHGVWRDVTSADVNDFLRGLAGDGFSAKDFRTWGGTAFATGHLGPVPVDDDGTLLDAAELAAIDLAAERLGNTRAVARAAYVAPHVPASWRAGVLSEVWRASRRSPSLSRPERAAARVLSEFTLAEV